MDAKFVQKVLAFSLSDPVERALALATVECHEHGLYLYPVLHRDKFYVDGHRFFCVLPHSLPERNDVRKKLLSLLEVIAQEEGCVLATAEICEDPIGKGVISIYFTFKRA